MIILGCVVQNFYNENPFLSRTLRYNTFVMRKLIPHIILMSKFNTHLYSNFRVFFYMRSTISTYYLSTVQNNFVFYNMFNNPLLGSWSNNMVKTYYLSALTLLNLGLSSSKQPNDITCNFISHSTNLNYFNPFRVISFNISNKIHKRNILYFINFITNFNSSFVNYWQTNLLYTIYPQWFLLLNCNDNYYFRIKRY